MALAARQDDLPRSSGTLNECIDVCKANPLCTNVVYDPEASLSCLPQKTLVFESKTYQTNADKVVWIKNCHGKSIHIYYFETCSKKNVQMVNEY